jgi:protein gp37
MHPDWAGGLLKQCKKAGVAFHFKQWGHWVPAEIAAGSARATVIEIPEARPVRMVRLPKKEAGRILSGKTWDDFPRIRIPAHA